MAQGWVTAESSLPAVRALAAGATWRDWLYVVGGTGNVAAPNGSLLLSLLKARVEPNGNVGPWKTIATLATGKVSPAVHISDHGLMYIIGGTAGVVAPKAGELHAGAEVWIGKLNQDGDIQGALTKSTTLPAALQGAAVAKGREYLYLIGGQTQKLTLSFDTSTGNFTAGDTVTGLTSGATGTVMADVDGGVTGTLKLTGITGVFVNDEVVQGALGGRAVVNGTIGVNRLDYDGQTSNFAVSNLIRGGTSGAEAVVDADTDGGVAGTLDLSSIVGAFQDNENLSVVRGAAVANGVLSASKLDYDAQATNFTLGQRIRGGTSGAEAIIDVDTDAGAAGTLELSSITGTFQDNEAIKVVRGAALANGIVYRELAYNTQTGNWTVGEVVTGGTSGATGTVMADNDGGASGTLKLTGTTGAFQNAEALTGNIAGAATCGGVLGSTKIDYDAQTSNFTLTDVLTGSTSGATATIGADADGGATGTLTLSGIVGTFQNDEPLRGVSAAAFATVDRTLYKTLGYDGQTANFTVGDTVRGSTSAAVATIEGDTDGGATGTLRLIAITGAFQNDENIRGISPTFALANLTLYKPLGYDGQTGNFVVGETVTGLTSGASLVVESQVDAGATGSIVASRFSGANAFQNNETLAGSLSGQALVNGDPAADASENLSVYRARIMADGTLGPWASCGLLPDQDSPRNSIAADGEMLYCLSSAKLYWAKADGSELGTWSSMLVPVDVIDSKLLVLDGFLMVLGGDVTGSSVRTVRGIRLNSKGPDGTWFRTSDMPAAVTAPALALMENTKHVFVMGGHDGVTESAKVRHAQILNGVIGGEKI